MRKQSHVSGYVSKVKSLSEKEISTQFHLPIIAAAKKLGVCVTALKSRCRQLGISRWPYRKVRKVDNVIKALVDQKTVLKPQKTAVEKCSLQNALDIRNHILSNPNSTAHLKIKKRKNSASLSEDASSDTSSEQEVFRGDNYSTDAACLDRNAEPQERVGPTFQPAVQKAARETATVEFAPNSAAAVRKLQSVQNLLQSLNVLNVQAQTTPLYNAQNQLAINYLNQLPVGLLANAALQNATMPLQQVMPLQQQTQTEIFKEQFAKAFGFNNMGGGLPYNNFSGQQNANTMLQLALEQRWNCAIQANLAKCVIMNK